MITIIAVGFYTILISLLCHYTVSLFNSIVAFAKANET